MEKISIKEYYDAILAEREKQVNYALAAAKEAVTLAEKNSEKWRSNANEWRSAMDDREVTFLHKQEFLLYKENVDKSIKVLETKQAIVDSKAASWLVWVGLFFTGASFFFSVIGLLITLYVVFLK